MRRWIDKGIDSRPIASIGGFTQYDHHNGFSAPVACQRPDPVHPNRNHRRVAISPCSKRARPARLQHLMQTERFRLVPNTGQISVHPRPNSC
jgi:hypothetical protein